MAQDVEDGLDQMMIQLWQNTAQSLRQLHNDLKQEVRSVRRDHRMQVARMNQLKAQEQERLRQWEQANHARLNDGFEQTLKATVLNPAFLQEPKPSDIDLLKSWSVTDWLHENGDPGFSVDLARARRILRDEWSMRHGTNIETEADRLSNNISIHYCRQTPELQETMESFRKAGIVVDPIFMPEQAYRRSFGDKATFHVDSRMTGEWDGWDRDNIIQAVLVSPLSGDIGDELGQRVGMLRDMRLPETSGADNTAVGDEPATVRETGAFETQPAAPMPTGESADPTPTAVGDGSGDFASSVTRETATFRVPDGADDEPMDLTEREEWAGPDMFGELSPDAEVGMAAASPSIAPSSPVPGLEEADTLTTGRKR